MKRIFACMALLALVAPAAAFARDVCDPADANCVEFPLEVVFSQDDTTYSPTCDFCPELAVGDSFFVAVQGDFPEGSAIQGWNFGVGIVPPEALTIEDPDNDVSVEGLDLPASFFDQKGPDFGGRGFVAIYVLGIGTSMPAGDDQLLVKARVQVAQTGPVDFVFDPELKLVETAQGVGLQMTADGATVQPAVVEEKLAVAVGEGGGDPCDPELTLEELGQTCEDCPEHPECPVEPNCDPEMTLEELGETCETCPDHPECDVGGCPEDTPDYAFYFGSDPASDATVDGDTLSVNMRNTAPALGFSLGVSTDGTSWSFSDQLGTDANRLIELIITDDMGESQTPATNAATVPDEPFTVAKGAALEAIPEGSSFFNVDTAPGEGGPGFTVGYVADTSGSGDVIPAVEDTEESCGLNEILVVTFGEAPEGEFVRGDVNGDGRLNVTDGAVAAQNIFFPEKSELVKFDCDDMLDANDDGGLDTSDVLMILAWVFQNGPDLPAPFPDCGADPTEDDLGCVESNCAP